MTIPDTRNTLLGYPVALRGATMRVVYK